MSLYYSFISFSSIYFHRVYLRKCSHHLAKCCLVSSVYPRLWISHPPPTDDVISTYPVMLFDGRRRHVELCDLPILLFTSQKMVEHWRTCYVLSPYKDFFKEKLQIILAVVARRFEEIWFCIVALYLLSVKFNLALHCFSWMHALFFVYKTCAVLSNSQMESINKLLPDHSIFDAFEVVYMYLPWVLVLSWFLVRFSYVKTGHCQCSFHFFFTALSRNTERN